MATLNVQITLRCNYARPLQFALENVAMSWIGSYFGNHMGELMIHAAEIIDLKYSEQVRMAFTLANSTVSHCNLGYSLHASISSTNSSFLSNLL